MATEAHVAFDGQAQWPSELHGFSINRTPNGCSTVTDTKQQANEKVRLRFSEEQERFKTGFPRDEK